jgi:hypothetical protein
MTHPTRRSPARSRSAGLLAWAVACALLLVAPAHAAARSLDGASSAAGVSAAAAPELHLALPPPTGRLPVGVHSRFLADPSRTDPATGGPRTLPVRVWYPTREPDSGPEAHYLSAAVQPVIEQALGAPAGSLGVDTHARSGAPMRHRIRGVILVSPGLGNLVAFSTAQVVDLASRGWVLVTFDHPHDTFVVEQPDGTLIFADPAGAPVEPSFAARVLDVGVVLRRLAELVPGLHPRVPVGMFGHSLGGAAAAEALLLYPSLRAGVDLDGSPHGRVVQEGLDEPFGIMVSNVRDQPGVDDPNLDALISRLRGPHPFEQLDIGHNGFTDFVVFNRQASLADPALGARFEAVLATGVADLAGATAAVAAQRRFLGAFMARYVDRDDDG